MFNVGDRVKDCGRFSRGEGTVVKCWNEDQIYCMYIHVIFDNREPLLKTLGYNSTLMNKSELELVDGNTPKI